MMLTIERFESSVIPAGSSVVGEPAVQVTDNHDGVTLTFHAEEYASLTGWEILSKVRAERASAVFERDAVNFGSGV